MALLIFKKNMLKFMGVDCIFSSKAKFLAASKYASKKIKIYNQTFPNKNTLLCRPY